MTKDTDKWKVKQRANSRFYLFILFLSPGLCTYETDVELGLQWLLRKMSDFITSNCLVFRCTSQLEVEIIAKLLRLFVIWAIDFSLSLVQSCKETRMMKNSRRLWIIELVCLPARDTTYFWLLLLKRNTLWPRVTVYANFSEFILVLFTAAGCKRVWNHSEQKCFVDWEMFLSGEKYICPEKYLR